jgi:integrase
VASYSKRGNRYQIRWRDPDGTNRGYSCPDLTTTKKIVRQIEEYSALGRVWRSPREVEVPSLIKLCDEYINETKRLKAPGTAEQREIAIANFLRFLGADETHWYGPDDLTRSNLSGFYDYMIGERKCSAVYAGEQVRKVERWWTWLADSDDWCDLVPRPKRLELPEMLPTPAAVAPSWEEMDRVVEAANGWYRNLFVVLRYTGLRKSQAMRLTWNDFDLDAGELYVRPALGKSRQERAGRRIPISAHLVEAMAGWGVREGFVVPCPGARRKLDHESVQYLWKRAGAREAIWNTRVEDDRRVLGHPTHAFRKGIESGLLQLGANALAVEYLLGHKLPGVLTSYVDPTTLPLRDTIDLVPKIGGPVKVKRLRKRDTAS